jgi:hypothetical protein
MPTGKKIEKQNEERAKIEKVEDLVYKILDIVDDFSNLDGVDDWKPMVDRIVNLIMSREVLNEK